MPDLFFFQPVKKNYELSSYLQRLFNRRCLVYVHQKIWLEILRQRFLLFPLLLPAAEIRFYFMHKGLHAKINPAAYQKRCKDCPEIPVTVFIELKNGIKDDDDTRNN